MKKKSPVLFAMTPDLNACLERAYQSVISKELIFGSFTIKYDGIANVEPYEFIDIRRIISDIFPKVLIVHGIDIKPESVKVKTKHISKLEREISTKCTLSNNITCEFEVSEDWLGQCYCMMVSMSGKGKGYSRYYDNVDTAQEFMEAIPRVSQDFMMAADIFEWEMKI